MKSKFLENLETNLGLDIILFLSGYVLSSFGQLAYKLHTIQSSAHL